MFAMASLRTAQDLSSRVVRGWALRRTALSVTLRHVPRSHPLLRRLAASQLHLHRRHAASAGGTLAAEGMPALEEEEASTAVVAAELAACKKLGLRKLPQPFVFLPQPDPASPTMSLAISASAFGRPSIFAFRPVSARSAESLRRL